MGKNGVRKTPHQHSILVEIGSHDWGGGITAKMLVYISISYINNHGMKTSKSGVIPEKHLLSAHSKFHVSIYFAQKPKARFSGNFQGIFMALGKSDVSSNLPTPPVC